MIRLILLFSILVTAFIVKAEMFSYRFSSTPLPDALQEILKDYPTIEISFIYNELENYRTSTIAQADNAYDALLQTVGRNPVSVIKASGIYYIENCQSIEKDEDMRVFSGRIVYTDNDAIPYAGIAFFEDSVFVAVSSADADGFFKFRLEAINMPRLRVSSFRYNQLR